MEIATPCRDETARLEALYALELLDTPAEERFDRWTKMAQRYFDVSMSLICLVDVDRQWFKSRQGISASETARSISFCGHAIKSDEIFVVEDARSDPRFADNPLVTGPPFIRFYAACPLRAPTGQRVGTLCLIDPTPRTFPSKDAKLLREMGILVEHELATKQTKPFSLKSLLAPKRLAKGAEPLIKAITGQLGASAITVACFVLLFGLGLTIEHQRQQRLYAEAQRTVLSSLTGLRGNLESILNAKLYLAQGLSGLVHARPDIDSQDFQRYAQEISGNVRGIRSLQLARGGVVSHVWPLQGNAAALGHNLLADPSRRQAAQQAISNRALWLAGPVTLRQGGDALIGRLPIFLDHADRAEEFWGFATVLLDLDEVLTDSGVTELSERYRIAIRGVDAAGDAGEVFYGDPATFASKPVTLSVTLPAGSWQLAASPKHGWAHYSAFTLTIWLGLGLAAMLLSLLLYALLRLPRHLRQAVANSSSALSRSESRFSDAIDSMSDGFIIYDRDDRAVAVNQQLRQLYPDGQGMDLGDSYEDFIRAGLACHRYRTNGTSDFFDATQRAHSETHSTSEHELSDGRWVQVVESTMGDGGKVCFHRDISAAKHQYDQLIQAKQRAEEANSAKSQFLATISHELRTPLNGVLGLLNILSEDPSLNITQHRHVFTAHDSAQQLLNILNEILDISKMEAGKLRLDCENFTLADTLRSAANLQRASIEHKGLSFAVEIDPALSVPVQGDSGRLRQVLLNLLSNACKFTPSGEVKLAASLSEATDDNIGIAITVSDTGIGFEQQQAETLLEPFTQLDSKANRQYSGSGLGLAICQRLVTMMGGELSIQSSPGNGSSFTVNLHLPRGEHQLEASRPMSAPTPTELGWPNIRVLLAEDGTTNQLVIKAMLENSGYRIEIAHNGEEALRAVKNFCYDIILMDVYMPILDGIAATQLIRQEENGRSIPIIALTANAMQGDKERFLAAGMNHFLAKPVSKQDLLSAMYHCLSPKYASVS